MKLPPPPCAVLLVVCAYVYIEVDGHDLGEPKFLFVCGSVFSGFYPQGVFIPLCNDCKRSHVDCVLNNISPERQATNGGTFEHWQLDCLKHAVALEFHFDGERNKDLNCERL